MRRVSKIGFQCGRTLPIDRNSNSHANGCERIPLLTRKPLKRLQLAVEEATCVLQSCDRWWAKRYETSKRARENNFIVPARSRVRRRGSSISLPPEDVNGRTRTPAPSADWRKRGNAVFLFPCGSRSDNDGLKTVILKFREVFWVHTQWSPNTGMRQISPLPMRFPLYLSRAATRGGNYRLSSSTEFYGHFSHSAPQAKWQGSPTLRQTSFNWPDTLNTVIWLSTKCLPIQGRRNRKLMAFPQILISITHIGPTSVKETLVPSRVWLAGCGGEGQPSHAEDFTMVRFYIRIWNLSVVGSIQSTDCPYMQI